MSTEQAPPQYVPPGENAAPADAPEIPDDFKYSDIIAECDIDIRHRFMQRVYLLLAAQLSATVLLSWGLMSHPVWEEWALTHSWAMILSAIGSFGFMIGATVMRRKYPWNLAFLALFTAAESWLVGTITAMMDTRIVLNAFFITVVVFVALSLFAVQTKYDLTSWLPYLVMLLTALLGLGFIGLFVHSSGLELIYSYIAVVLFSGFILVDTQVIMNRAHPEDEIPATIELYLDIINLFINLLRILSDNSN